MHASVCMHGICVHASVCMVCMCEREGRAYCHVTVFRYHVFATYRAHVLQTAA